jgi:hypothetical protein
MDEARGANKVQADEGLWGKEEGRVTGEWRDSVDDAVMCC